MKQNKMFSSRQERKVADALGWDVVSGSGARFHPGDVVAENWLGECKTHTQPGHKIEFLSKVWNKIYLESISLMRRPCYFVDDGSQSLSKTWVMLNALPIDVKSFGYFEDVGISIRFYSGTAKELLYDKSLTSDDIAVFSLRFNDDNVWLTTFDMFKKIVEVV